MAGVEGKRRKTCICTAWKQVPGPSGYCPDIRRCLYVQTRLRVRNLQQQHFRQFEMLLPKLPRSTLGYQVIGKEVNDLKEYKDKLEITRKKILTKETMPEHESDKKSDDEIELPIDEEHEDDDSASTKTRGLIITPLRVKAELGKEVEVVKDSSLKGKKLKDKRSCKETSQEKEEIEREVEGSQEGAKLGAAHVSFWLEQSPSGLNVGEDGTGSVVWGPGVILLDFLSGVCQSSGSLIFESKRVVELGTGTGIGSIAAAICGAPLILATDRFHELGRKNFERLALTPTPVTLAEHVWGQNLPLLGKQLTTLMSTPFAGQIKSEDAGIDVLLLADVLYFSSYYQELLITMTYITNFVNKGTTSSVGTTTAPGSIDGKETGDPSGLRKTATTATTAPEPIPKFPLVILAHKRRSEETENEFFGEIQKTFKLFSLNGNGRNILCQHRHQHLDEQDPNLEIILFVHQSHFIVDTTPPLLPLTRKRTPEKGTSGTPLKESKTLATSTAQISSSLSSTLTRSSRDIVDEQLREHWFLKHIKDFLIEMPTVTIPPKSSD